VILYFQPNLPCAFGGTSGVILLATERRVRDKKIFPVLGRLDPSCGYLSATL